MLFKLVETGETITWYGFFTEKTEDRTLEALRHCGWEGDDLSDLRGITSNEVYVVIEHETNDEGETHARVRWVNSGAGGALAMKATMDRAAATAFAQRMKGKVVAQRQKMPKPSTPAGRSRPSPNVDPGYDDDAPF